MKTNKLISSVFCTLLAVLMLLSISACTDNDDGTTKSSEKPQTAGTPLPEGSESPTEPRSAPVTSPEETVVPTTEPAEFTFADTLFIGDSRTDGLHEYGNLDEATFFAETSMNSFKLLSTEIEVDGMGKVTLDTVLDAKDYGKIYIMLGLNEMGYKFETLVAKYEEVLAHLHEAQPNAIIYIVSVLHVSEERNETQESENNTNINAFNAALAEMDNGTYMLYMDINTVFDDENGNLNAEYTRDGCHLTAKNYPKWVEWMRTSTPTP